MLQSGQIVLAGSKQADHNATFWGLFVKFISFYVLLEFFYM